MINKNQGSIIIAFIFSISFVLIVFSFFQQQSINETIIRSNTRILITSLIAHQTSIRTIFLDIKAKSLIIDDTIKNPNLKNCKTGECPVFDEQDLVTYDQSGTIYTDNSSTQGFTANGVPCNTFNSIAGNNKCPYRFKIVWIPDCPPISFCNTPNILVKGFVEFKSATSTIVNFINLSRFDFVAVL